MLRNDLDIKKVVGLVAFVIVLIVCIIYLLVINRVDGYLIIDESIVLSKNGGNIKKVSEYSDVLFKECYHIIGDDFDYSDVILNRSNSGEWNYMDKDYKSLDIVRVKLAYSGKFKNVKLADYNFSYYSSDDDAIFKKALGDRKLSDFSNSVMKSSYDFNGDGKLENIYTLTNVNAAVSKENRYSLLVLESNGKVTIMDRDSDNVFIVRSILDLDNDGKYEVIVSKGSEDVAPIDGSYQIYKINGSGFKKIMDS